MASSYECRPDAFPVVTHAVLTSLPPQHKTLPSSSVLLSFFFLFYNSTIIYFYYLPSFFSLLLLSCSLLSSFLFFSLLFSPPSVSFLCFLTFPFFSLSFLNRRFVSFSSSFFPLLSSSTNQNSSLSQFFPSSLLPRLSLTPSLPTSLLFLPPSLPPSLADGSSPLIRII